MAKVAVAAPLRETDRMLGDSFADTRRREVGRATGV